MIYTSHFKNNNIPENAVLLSISSIKHSTFHGDTIDELVPSNDIIMGSKKGIVTPYAFQQLYKKQLTELNFTEIHEKINSYDNGSGVIVLLSTGEAKGTSCYRSSLIWWFKSNGVLIKEL